ncbi:MAG: hypothetical protein AAF988_02510, partial [Pseudomonadota bacterium]
MQNQTNDVQALEAELKPVKKLPADPNKAMQQMMNTIDALREKVTAETAALKEADTKQFMTLQDDKIIIARDYLNGMKDLLGRGDDLKNADPLLLQRFTEMREQFGELVKDNLEALKRMGGGMKKLEERIINAARIESDKENKFSYGA